MGLCQMKCVTSEAWSHWSAICGTVTSSHKRKALQSVGIPECGEVDAGIGKDETQDLGDCNTILDCDHILSEWSKCSASCGASERFRCIEIIQHARNGDSCATSRASSSTKIAISQRAPPRVTVFKKGQPQVFTIRRSGVTVKVVTTGEGARLFIVLPIVRRGRNGHALSGN